MAINEHENCSIQDRWFTCKNNTGEWITSQNTKTETSHTKNVNFNLVFFDISLPLLRQTRDFHAIYSNISSSSISGFVYGSGVGGAGDQTVYPCGVTSSGSYSGSFSESYSVISSKIHYMDVEKRILCWTEYECLLSFSKAFTDADIVYFRNAYTYESFMFASFSTPTATGTSTLKLYFDGIVTEIATVAIGLPAMDIDLNIVYPHPACTLVPAIGNPVRNLFWYDYCLVRTSYLGAVRNFEKMELDGGDDYYYPEWIRTIDNFLGIEALSKADAYSRYAFQWEPTYIENIVTGPVEDTHTFKFDRLPIGYNILCGFVEDEMGTYYSIFGDHHGIKIDNHIYIDKATKETITINNDILKDVYITDGENKIALPNYAYHSFAPMGRI